MAFSQILLTFKLPGALGDVRDWKMLMEAVQIPENFIPLTLARLTELGGEELKVTVKIFCSICFFNSLFLNRQADSFE